MPKVIDHDQRRREYVEATLRLIRRGGVEGVTSRAIAAELGVATGGIWYYFADIGQVIGAAHDEVFRRTQQRVNAAIAGRSGLDALYEMLKVLLPMDAESQFEARVVVGYWGRVASDERLALSQENAEEEWHGQIGGMIEEAITTGDLLETTPVDELVELLVAITLAEQIKWVTRSMFPVRRPPLAVVDACLAPYRALT